MQSLALDQISLDPKLAAPRRKVAKRIRTIKQLFEDVEQETTFKDKRGRPWLKNPRRYARDVIAGQKFVSDADSKRNFNEPCTVDNRLEPTFSSAERDEYSASSSASDEEGDHLEAIADFCNADWNELIGDVPPAVNMGKRLALLHFDWDNAKAENIYMVLQSFLPPRGHIERVTIYPSEFGMKRLNEETVKGPHELVDDLSDEDCGDVSPTAKRRQNDRKRKDDGDDDDDGDFPPLEIEDRVGWRKTSTRVKRRIRRYQLNRLKYFYAIIEFDSAETAEAVYNACDGYEYESSGARLDLRFVRDDETFSVPPEYAHLVTECREINTSKYAPRLFETAALHSTRIGISWDKTPDERTAWLRDQFKPDVDPKITLTEHADELSKYVALSSSGASTAASSDVDEPPPAQTVPRIRRHRPKKLPPEEIRAALLGVSREDASSDNDAHLGDLQNSDTEVFDLRTNESSISSNTSDTEEYDLQPVEKRFPWRAIKSRADGKIRRRILPEAVDEKADDSSGNETEVSVETEKRGDNRKKRYKEKQRHKILSKKRETQERKQLRASLWPTSRDDNSAASDDNRFDAFLTDSAYQISQTHPDYKEATDFIVYMRTRKAISESRPS